MSRYRRKMLSLYKLIFIFLCIIDANRVFTAEPSLESVLKSTTIFFDKLKHDYESQPASLELYESIEKKIVDYSKKVKKSTNSSRGKRQLELNKETGILSEFEQVSNLDLPRAIDTTFFSQRIGPQELWYAASLNSSGITLLRYQDHSFDVVDFLELENGIRLDSHNCESTTILIVQRSIGDVLVLLLSEENSKETFIKVQTLNIPAVTHSTFWQEMKEIYLAVASIENLTIYKWLGDNFDRIHENNIGAMKLVPFRTGGSMHMIATSKSKTSILKFLINSDEFVVTQKLIGAKDATAFHLDFGHLGENFLALIGKNFTVIYKKFRHQFVPFQRIAKAEKIRLYIHDSAILLILIDKSETKFYQYDGWKFVESNIRAFGISDVVPVSLKSNLLAIRIKNSHDEKSSLWSFRRVTLRRRKTWTSLREETKNWCRNLLDKILREPLRIPHVPKLEDYVRIQRGYIKNLRVREVNGRSVEDFEKLTERWKVIVNETEHQKNAINNYISRINPIFNNLRAGAVRVNCTTVCRTMRTETKMKNNFFERFRRIDEIHGNLDFRNVKLSFQNNLKCPIPSLKFRDAEVNGAVNGEIFSKFVDDTLMITGNQELSGSHVFNELRATKAKIPLDVATNYTRQEIVTKSLKVGKLDIKSGGLFLPLNGKMSTLTGSITVPKAKINVQITMQGGIRGKGGEKSSPMIHVTKPLELFGNYTLKNMKIVENLRVNEITRSNGKSLNEIISNAVPLNSRHVTPHFEFRNDKVSWKNITLRNFPYKWVKKSHTEHLIISGTKRATMPNITIGNLAYTNLPTPRLPLQLCAVAAMSDDIWESNLVIDRGSGKFVRAINVFDKSELNEIYLDSAICLSDVDWSLKNLTGSITVNEAKIKNIAGMDYQGLEKSIKKWIEPGRLKGPIIVQDMKVNNLFSPNDIKISRLPLHIGNAKSMQNVHVGKLNGVDFAQFINNIVKINDTISLTNVTFVGHLVANAINASETSFSLQQDVQFGYFGSKEIFDTLDSEAMILPYDLRISSSVSSLNIITNGSVTFVNEPKVVNVNSENLSRLYDEIWMKNQPTAISAEFVEMKNVTFESDLKILNSFETPKLGPWNGMMNRLLSKTRTQTINVKASFDSVNAPNIIGAAKSRLRSNDSHLNDLEFNSLKNDDSQVIKNNWHFEELIIKENVNLRGRINNLKLETDIVRSDVERNEITGKKIVNAVTARNIDGLEFGKFAKNALRINSNKNRTIIIKGRKTFKNVKMQDIKVDGTISRSRIENVLLKSSRQNLRGNKSIQGSLKTPNIVTNKTVNGIKLEYFAKHQLKKRAKSQIIKTPIALWNNLTIFGNVTIDGLYQGVAIRNFEIVNNGLEKIGKITSELINYAEGINVALANRAVYFDKLELLEKNSTPLIADPEKNKLFFIDNLGNCKIEETSLYCNEKKVFDLRSTLSNGSSLLQVGIVRLSGNSLIVCVTSDPDGGIFIYQFDHKQDHFNQIAVLRVVGIIAGSLTQTMDCLWISLRLRDQIMIVRYELWAQHFEEWILPGSSAFLMSTTPTEELLIIRSDGVWKLGGLAGPRHAFRATLNGQIDTFSFGPNYYVQLTHGNSTTLLNTRYIDCVGEENQSLRIHFA